MSDVRYVTVAERTDALRAALRRDAAEIAAELVASGTLTVEEAARRLATYEPIRSGA